ncbi:MAG: hypothetical protein RIE58_06635 [Vicingaceae bacterium]
MNEVLNQARNIHKVGCVSIVLNTHRSSPENRQDPIRLKNLLHEAEKRIAKEVEAAIAKNIVKNLKALVNSIDHSKNLDSLILFANADHSSYTTLPVKVEDRVVLDRTFATRDLTRAMRRARSFFALVLSKQEARFLMGLNDQLVHEYKGNFPMKNDVFTTDALKISMSKNQDHLLEEFFNRVDKEVKSLIGSSKVPVVLATVKRNADHFLKMADHKKGYPIELTGNYNKEPLNKVIQSAWPLVKAYFVEQDRLKIEILKKASSAGDVLTDLNEIWQAIQTQKGQYLFVQKDFFQTAIKEGMNIRPIDSDNYGENRIDDLVDEMVESIHEKGGEAVFLDDFQQLEFENIALVTRPQ